MDKLGIKDNALFCESISEYNKLDIFKKLEDLNDETKLVELRLDYLLSNINDIDYAIDIIKEIKKSLVDKKIIATIRTYKDGGNIYLNNKTYIKYITKLIEESKADSVDIEYKIYLENKRKLKDLIKNSKKDIILSYHEWTKQFTYEEYVSLLNDMSKDFKGIVKVAIKPYNRDDVFNLMNAAKEVGKNYKDVRFTCFSMGKLGTFSRVNYKYTNSKILFINSERGINVLGQPCLHEFKRLEKLLK